LNSEKGIYCKEMYGNMERIRLSYKIIKIIVAARE
jgi:hypothetical protein